MALTITSVAEGSTVTLTLAGRLSAVEAQEFNQTFPGLAQGMQDVLLDFSNVEYISSMGLRSLFMARKVMTRQGGQIKILNPSPEVMEVFEATSFDNIITIIRGSGETATRFYPLRPIQRWMVDTHFMKAKSTMMNTGALIRLDPAVDMERLAGVLNDILAAYDIFRCRLVIHPETGDICQRFDGEITKVVVETLSDEAFEQRKQEIKLPYDLIDHSLYRVYLMVTSTAKYFYADFYHAIMDGAALAMLFCREVDKRYTKPEKFGKNTSQPASYAEYILEESQLSEEELREGHAYWRNMLEDFDEKRHLPPPDVTGGSETPDHEIEVPFPIIDKHFFRGKNFSENTFFMGASLLALAKSAGSRE
ncbi:MAG: anti-sigma factor antagonist, partial [Acidaminococcaceae bacterium]|nr:anti-sigma factor antagonist [Acidaminococcaceae bacterium]